MQGNKLEFFVFELSFIGWAMLASIIILVALVVLNVFLPEALATIIAMLLAIPINTYIYVSNANFYNTIYLEDYNRF
jgi:uncharacterized membrane protein